MTRPPPTDAVALPPGSEARTDWLEALLSDSRAVVEGLLDEVPVPVEQLRAHVIAYRAEIAAAGPQADHELGDQLAAQLLVLLDRVGGDAVACGLAQVAVRYFVMDDDGDDDLMSPFGFDDDVEVFNAVVEHLGHDDLVIEA